MHTVSTGPTEFVKTEPSPPGRGQGEGEEMVNTCPERPSTSLRYASFDFTPLRSGRTGGEPKNAQDEREGGSSVRPERRVLETEVQGAGRTGRDNPFILSVRRNAPEVEGSVGLLKPKPKEACRRN